MRRAITTTAVLALLVRATLAQTLPPTGREGLPCPVTGERITLGEFLDLISAPGALDLNLVVRDSVPRGRFLAYPLAKLTCGEALELVARLEDLEFTAFKAGIWVVSSRADRPAGLPTTRTFTLTHVSPEAVVAHVRKTPDLVPRIDPEQLVVDHSRRSLTAILDARALATLETVVRQLDRPGTAPVVIGLSFLTKDELDTALVTLGPGVTGGIRPENVLYLPATRSVAVSATPGQVEALRRLIASIDVAPEPVQVALTSSSSAASGRAGIVHDAGSDRSTGSRTLWITTLSGSPARFSLGQVFNVVSSRVVVVPGGGAIVDQTVDEIPVGLAIEVLPRVRGPLVTVQVSLVDEVPTRVHPWGVDRTSSRLVTTATLRKGTSVSIGGLSQTLVQSGRSGVAGLLSARSSRNRELGLILSVR